QSNHFLVLNTTIRSLNKDLTDYLTLDLDWSSIQTDYLEFIAEKLEAIQIALIGDEKISGWLDIINTNLMTQIDYLKMISEKEFVGGDTVVNNPPEGTNF